MIYTYLTPAEAQLVLMLSSQAADQDGAPDSVREVAGTLRDRLSEYVGPCVRYAMEKSGG